MRLRTTTNRRSLWHQWRRSDVRISTWTSWPRHSPWLAGNSVMRGSLSGHPRRGNCSSHRGRGGMPSLCCGTSSRRRMRASLSLTRIAIRQCFTCLKNVSWKGSIFGFYVHGTQTAVAAGARAFIEQHPGVTVEVRSTTDFHDRFIVLDRSVCVHVGASIKDAGKKAFMVSRIEDPSNREAMLRQLDESWANGTLVH